MISMLKTMKMRNTLGKNVRVKMMMMMKSKTKTNTEWEFPCSKSIIETLD